MVISSELTNKLAAPGVRCAHTASVGADGARGEEPLHLVNGTSDRYLPQNGCFQVFRNNANRGGHAQISINFFVSRDNTAHRSSKKHGKSDSRSYNPRQRGRPVGGAGRYLWRSLHPLQSLGVKPLESYKVSVKSL